MNNGDMPAMPSTVSDGYSRPIAITGLTKREYFAGLMMQSIAEKPRQDGGYNFVPQRMAREAVKMADALLAELQATESWE